MPKKHRQELDPEKKNTKSAKFAVLDPLSDFW